MKPFQKPLHLKDLSGETHVVTGANSGIGFETAKRLAIAGADVVMVCRNPQRAAAAQTEIARTTGHEPALVLADLADLEQVAETADALLDRWPQIDALINNAGIYLAQRYTTPQGYEKTLAVNYLAPFLLTWRLQGALAAAADPRVVMVTSGAHLGGWMREDWMYEKGYQPWRAYADAKLYSLMFTRTAARVLAPQGIRTYGVHPGMVATNFAQTDGGLLGIAARLAAPFLRTSAQGADSVIWAAASEEARPYSGAYIIDRKPRRGARRSHNKAAQRRLWNRTAALLELENATL